MLRLVTSLASPAGPRARLTAFIFHRVLPEPDPLQPELPDVAGFEQSLDWIGAQFRVLDPRLACERLVAGGLPARAAILTFDDGYRDNAELVAPILHRRGWPAAFFVATGFLEGRVMFNDRIIEALRATRAAEIVPAAIGLDAAPALPLDGLPARREAIARLISAIKHLPAPRREAAVACLEDCLGAGATRSPMMDAAQVAGLQAAGMTLGGHTRHHPILAMLEPGQAQEEIAGGFDDLREISGESPTLFAYPNGRFGPDWQAPHMSMVRRAGFAYAFSTDPGAADRRSPALALPRFTPWDRSRLRFQARAWGNLLTRPLAA